MRKLYLPPRGTYCLNSAKRGTSKHKKKATTNVTAFIVYYVPTLIEQLLVVLQQLPKQVDLLGLQLDFRYEMLEVA